MAIRSGIDAQIGFVEETTWGTGETPTRFLEFQSEGIELTNERIESSALRAAQRVLRNDRYADNTKGVSGPVTFLPETKGFGLILKHMLGSVSITTPSGGTLTRDHDHTIGDLYANSLTTQVGVPDVNGTVQPFTYTGCKFTDWEFTQNVDEFLQLAVTLDGQAVTTGTALASVSYASSTELFPFHKCTVSVGGATLNTKGFTLSGTNGLATDRYFLRGDASKLEQIPAAMVEITGELTPEFEDLTEFARFQDTTEAQIIATWELAANGIESGFAYRLQITLPACRFDGSTPTVDGPEIVDMSYPFKVLDDGTNEPITISYRTTDTAS